MKTVIEMAREVRCESDLTSELLCGLFAYDSANLRWNVKLNKRVLIGEIAGSKDGHGYVQIMINGKRYKAHRLIYLMFCGSLPKVIDHINGIRDDNRIENLRPATLEENARNAVRRICNTSGSKNVYWYARHGKWMVAIKVDGRQKHIGYFDTISAAEAASIAARNKHHKEFARHV
jgi:hypothetical protein